MLIEDVCESHGAKFKKKKLGTFGKISNFSFYYAHHMSTIEGGMICTNDKEIFQLAKVLRSHGMAREIGDKKIEKKIVNKYKKLSPKFIFLYPAYNFRNNEIGATIGLNQLKSLDKNNKIRTRNFKVFLKYLDKNKYRTDFNLEGSCNYAFPLIMKKASFKNRNKLEKLLMMTARGYCARTSQTREFGPPRGLVMWTTPSRGKWRNVGHGIWSSQRPAGSSSDTAGAAPSTSGAPPRGGTTSTPSTHSAAPGEFYVHESPTGKAANQHVHNPGESLVIVFTASTVKK